MYWQVSIVSVNYSSFLLFSCLVFRITSINLFQQSSGGPARHTICTHLVQPILSVHNIQVISFQKMFPNLTQMMHCSIFFQGVLYGLGQLLRKSSHFYPCQQKRQHLHDRPHPLQFSGLLQNSFWASEAKTVLRRWCVSNKSNLKIPNQRYKKKKDVILFPQP